MENLILHGFCKWVNIKDVNKLQLEGLTKSGAFDEFDSKIETKF